MRIIAGTYRSRVLRAPAGDQITRPTSDRVRESLFNILAPRMQGAKVLDLFAGSGILSLEAISRGASFATLCDRDHNACAAIVSNIASLAVENKTRLYRGDYEIALSSLSQLQERFDIICLDPPYRFGLVPKILEQIISLQILQKDGIIVVESSAKQPPLVSSPLQIKDQRRYGTALLSFLVMEDTI